MRTYVIADIGACHDSDRELMSQAVRMARACGVDAIKFQWTSDPAAMARRRGRAAEDGYAAVYARYLAWPAALHGELAAECREAGLDYMCTAFLPQDVAVVAAHVRHFKVASFEAEAVDVLRAHVAFLGGAEKRRMIVSLGMGASASVAHDATSSRWLAFLHCVSSYPAPVDSLNLARLREPIDECVSRSVPPVDGFSDHSDPALTWTGALAVAAGASIVEAHLRLHQTDRENPDYPHAMMPEQFHDYVRHIRFAERCLGTGIPAPQPCEEKMMRYRAVV